MVSTRTLHCTSGFDGWSKRKKAAIAKEGKGRTIEAHLEDSHSGSDNQSEA